jgi:hypothetical protein
LRTKYVALNRSKDQLGEIVRTLAGVIGGASFGFDPMPVSPVADYGRAG